MSDEQAQPTETEEVAKPTPQDATPEPVTAEPNSVEASPQEATPSAEPATPEGEAAAEPVVEGDAVYTDHEGKKHGAFIDHLTAGGEKLIAQLRLVLGGNAYDVPHSTENEPNTWHRN